MAQPVQSWSRVLVASVLAGFAVATMSTAGRSQAATLFSTTSVLASQQGVGTPSKPTDSAADARARSTEQKMTDEERLSMIISVMGANPIAGVQRDKRIPEGTPMSAGYTPGVRRLGVPALQSSDAGLGVTNPGYRPNDKGATAFPASIVVGASFN